MRRQHQFHFLIVTIVLLTFSAAKAEDCKYVDDFIYQKTMSDTSEVLIQEKTYSNHIVHSAIGDFNLKVTGGVFQDQTLEYYQYACSIDNLTNYRYSDKVIISTGSTSEYADKIIVIFPNNFSISVVNSDLKNNFEILNSGLKEIGPFSPEGALADIDAILAIGKMKLSASDYTKLVNAFR